MNIKKSIICKGLESYKINKSIKKTYIPKAGDIAIFKVTAMGKHTSIQGINGNNTYIFVGDYIMGAFGNRYASDQFEGYVPEAYHSEYHILGKGGAIGILISMHAKLQSKGTTNLRLIGYACDESGNVINSKYLRLQASNLNTAPRLYKMILSLGSSMDSGKTTTAGYLCRGLRAAKKKVGYIKLTGTVYTKDRHFVRDCGAKVALDFSDFGFPSTYMCDMDELMHLHYRLLDLLESKMSPEYVVIEIADGILQRETEMLLKHPAFMQQIDHIIFSAADSMGILSGVNLLEKMNARPFAVSGLFTTAPLLIDEVRKRIEQPIMTLATLANPHILSVIEKDQRKVSSFSHNGMHQKDRMTSSI